MGEYVRVKDAARARRVRDAERKLELAEASGRADANRAAADARETVRRFHRTSDGIQNKTRVLSILHERVTVTCVSSKKPTLPCVADRADDRSLKKASPNLRTRAAGRRISPSPLSVRVIGVPG